MLPALIGAGILQGLISILASTGVLSEGSSFYTVLSTISTAVFYFLPFLLGASSAKAFHTSPYLAIGVVAFFVHPDCRLVRRHLARRLRAALEGRRRAADPVSRGGA